MKIKFLFDKKEFIKGSQANYIAPQYKRLKEGCLDEWFTTLLFVVFLGWLWYPLIFLCSSRIVVKG